MEKYNYLYNIIKYKTIKNNIDTSGQQLYNFIYLINMVILISIIIM